MSTRGARLAAQTDRLTSRPLAAVPKSGAKQVHLRYSDVRTRLFQRLGRTTPHPPDALIIDLWSHQDAPFQLFIETASETSSARTSITIEPGENHAVVPASELGISRDRWPERIFVYPENDLTAHMVISTLDIAWLAPDKQDHDAGGESAVSMAVDGAERVDVPAPTVKVLVWDLDNTLWDGTLVEDGQAALALRQGVRELLEALDERGILLSVASKNDAAPAFATLEHFGIRDYFLVPEIHWSPKSSSIRRIARSLNLGLDSIAFVDDSAFERGEVRSSLGAIRIYEPDDLDELLGQPEFDVPVTPEARNRREMFRVEADRRRDLDLLEGDHDAFLRSCGLSLRVFTPTTPTEIERCVELIHRTNQLNLTTRRLDGAEFEAMLSNPGGEVFGMAAEDRFGTYGIIGVAILNADEQGPVLTDFLTSCRVAQKTIENAWFEWLRRRLTAGGSTTLRAVFIPTARNHLLRDVLDEVGFVVDTAGADSSPSDGTVVDSVPLTLALDQPIGRSSYVAVVGPGEHASGPSDE